MITSDSNEDAGMGEVIERWASWQETNTKYKQLIMILSKINSL